MTNGEGMSKMPERIWAGRATEWIDSRTVNSKPWWADVPRPGLTEFIRADLYAQSETDRKATMETLSEIDKDLQRIEAESAAKDARIAAAIDFVECQSAASPDAWGVVGILRAGLLEVNPKHSNQNVTQEPANADDSTV